MSDRWMPAKEPDYVLMCHKWLDVLNTEGILEIFMWLAVLRDETCEAIEAFLSAYDAFDDVDSTSNRIAKNVTKQKAEKAMREFANSSVRYNRFVTDEVRRELGIFPPKPATATPRPSSAPKLEVGTTTTHFQHRLKALHPDSEKKKKPDGVHGVRITWQVGGERPAGGGAMSHGVFSRKIDIIVSHGESDFGKQVWYSACYENAKGEAGPWTPLVETYVI